MSLHNIDIYTAHTGANNKTQKLFRETTVVLTQSYSQLVT